VVSIIYSDGTIQTTALTGGTGSVTWDAMVGKPLTFAPSVHNHDLLYKALTYVPSWSEITGKPNFFSGSYKDLTDKPDSIELGIALGQLPFISPPKKTTAEIDLITTTPTNGDILYDKTLGVWKGYKNGVWRIFVTTN
jgi:hypothetical protein